MNKMQKEMTVIDTLNQENLVLKMENEELKKKNDKVKEALTRAAGSVQGGIGEGES